MADRLRAVVFDAVGTLLHPQPGAIDVYWDYGRRYGSQLSSKQIGRRFRVALERDAAAALEDGRTSPQEERDRWQRIVTQIFDDVPAAGGPLFESLWEYFAQPEHWCVDPQTQACWQALRRHGLLIGIASNFDERLNSIVARETSLCEADFVRHSAEIGFRKPSGEFFSTVQQSLDVAPHELLMVGDDHLIDVVGALQAGWHAVWVDRAGAEAVAPLPWADFDANGAFDSSLAMRVNQISRIPDCIDLV